MRWGGRRNSGKRKRKVAYGRDKKEVTWKPEVQKEDNTGEGV